MEPLICEIVIAKRNAGTSAFLHLHLGGECTLWTCPPEFDSETPFVLGEWKLSSLECDQLIETDQVDCAI